MSRFGGLVGLILCQEVPLIHENLLMQFTRQTLLFLMGALLLSLVVSGCGGGTGSSQSSGGGGNSGGGGSSGGGGGSGGGAVQNSACNAMSLGQGGNLNGFRPFANDNLWNSDISNASVDANSTAIINYIGPRIGLHPDFGSGEYQGSTIGIPYVVVGGTQALGERQLHRVRQMRAILDRCRFLPMRRSRAIPIPATATGTCWCSDNSNCFLYELYSSYPERRRNLERRLGGGLGSAEQRAASLDLDFRRRRGACRFSPAWRAMTKWPRDTISACSALHPAPEPGRALPHRLRTGRRNSYFARRRQWECACG